MKDDAEQSNPSRGYVPGPWRQCGARGGECKCGLIWSVSADCIVATVNQPPDGDKQWEGPTREGAAATARLIAAAPDLLAACEEAIDYLPEGFVAANVAAAILKAKGI